MGKWLMGCGCRLVLAVCLLLGGCVSFLGLAGYNMKKGEEQAHQDLRILAKKSVNGKIIGTLKNCGKKRYSYVSIEFSLYDRKGNLVGSTLDNVTNLDPGETWKFSANIIDDDCYKFAVSKINGY